MKYIRPLTMAATLVLLLSDHASAQIAVAPPPYTLMVWGEATVASPPDSATIDIDITARRGTAQEASADNARQTAALIEAVKASLGGAGTITTASYSVRPEYRYPREGSSPQVAGYVATNIIRVVTSMLDRTGRLIDAAVASGGTIRQLEFALKDEHAVYTEALRQAARRARAEADALASALGLTVMRVLTAMEEPERAAPPTPFNAVALATESAASTPVTPGSIEIRARARLTVEFRGN